MLERCTIKGFWIRIAENIDIGVQIVPDKRKFPQSEGNIALPKLIVRKKFRKKFRKFKKKWNIGRCVGNVLQIPLPEQHNLSMSYIL